MANIYLILHKVRDEPAFDIAERTQIASEIAWVVSTSGHRAYPVAAWPLLEVVARGIAKAYDHASSLSEWNTIPDHYSPPRALIKRKFTEDDYANILDQMTDDEFNIAVQGSQRP